MMKVWFKIYLSLMMIIVLFSGNAIAFNLQIRASEEKIAVGSTVTFYCNANNGVAPYKYTWDFDDLTSYMYPKENQNPSHTFSWPGMHNVKVSVEDSSGAIERGEILVNVSTGAKVIANAVWDLGMDNTGKIDCSPAIRNWIKSLNIDAGGRIEFPSGTYLFGDEESVAGSRRAFRVDYKKKFEMVGISNEPAILKYKINTGDTDDPFDYFIYWDESGPSSDYYALFMNLHFIYERGGMPASSYSRNYLIYGFITNTDHHVTMQNCTIENYMHAWNGGGGRLVRNNILKWGKSKNYPDTYKYGESEAVYCQGNTLFKENYISQGEIGHSHLIYSGGTKTSYRDNVYIIRNYLDGFRGYGNAFGIHFYGEDGSTLQYKIVDGNIIKNVSHSGVIMGILGGPQYNSQHIKITNNIFDNCNTGINIWKSHADVVVENNQFQNITGYSLSVGRDTSSEAQGISFTNNTLGKGAGIDGGGSIGYVSATYGQSFSPNIDNESLVSVDDPGLWKFGAPKLCNVSANGSSEFLTLTVACINSGSGMESVARWPLDHGELIQVSADGKIWTEVQPYANQTTWYLPGLQNPPKVYVRIRDRHGNWSEKMSNYAISSPQSLRIIN